MQNKIVIAITGASGSMYARLLIRKLLQLRKQWEELAVVVTENAKLVWETEIGESFVQDEAVRYHTNQDFMAPFASGSGRYNIMFIVPCSMGTLGRIATGVSNDLITRAADVVLKERRKLICMIRDTPYNLIHIRNMETITLAGGIICPATPSFYSKPKDMEELCYTVVDRALDLAGLDIKAFRWGENS
jgi:flavin prenyltransferase